MRTIDRSTAFKRVKTMPRYGKNLDSLISNVLLFLLADKALPKNNRDHALSGDWVRYRECHLKPDLLLIYRKFDEYTLRLTRLGSHSELFK